MINQPWTTPAKVGFRFSFSFIISFILIKNNGALPLLGYLVHFLATPLREITYWFAKHVLHYTYDYSVYTNGSGDTSYDWVSLLVLFLLAIVVTLIWSLLDRRRSSYDVAYYWLTAIVRYYIAFMLINYGVIKLVHGQMPPPTLNRLMQPVGEMSPMGLAWTYFGYSKGYNIFVGIAEILAGLLLFRRTMVLGALVTMAVSINIMSTNYFFDVPVKMISTALLLLSIFLLLPAIKPLFGLLIQGKTVTLPFISKPRYDKGWKNKMMLVVKVLVLLLFFSQQISSVWNRPKLMAFYYKQSPLYGIYMIEEDQALRKTIPKDWVYIVFETEGYGSVRDRQYKRVNIDPKIDTVAKTITLNNYTLDYSVADNGDIFLKKNFDDHTEMIKLIKRDPKDFELMKREFNLIQEYPYNR